MSYTKAEGFDGQKQAKKVPIFGTFSGLKIRNREAVVAKNLAFSAIFGFLPKIGP